MNKKFSALGFLVALCLAAMTTAPAVAQQKKPNILVIWGELHGDH